MYQKIPDLTPENYVQMLMEQFTDAGDPIRAEQQRKYMKDQFAYCGLRAPEWMALLKSVFVQYGTFTGKSLEEFIRLCFESEYREIHYAGLQMMQLRLKEQNKSWIRVLEKCILTASWWDTVDWIAKLTGIHFKRFPALQHQYAYKWITSENMWLQRTAIIHQLFYREETDEALLFDLISRQAGSREFFIRKACGWALRQYAKTNPSRVRKFLKQQPLSGLTVRETMKQLDKM